MAPLKLVPVSGRYLSFEEREEIAILHAQKNRGTGLPWFAHQELLVEQRRVESLTTSTPARSRAPWIERFPSLLPLSAPRPDAGWISRR